MIGEARIKAIALYLIFKGLWVITGGVRGKILMQAQNVCSFPLQRQISFSELLSATLATGFQHPTRQSCSENLISVRVAWCQRSRYMG